MMTMVPLSRRREPGSTTLPCSTAQPTFGETLGPRTARVVLVGGCSTLLCVSSTEAPVPARGERWRKWHCLASPAPCLCSMAYAVIALQVQSATVLLRSRFVLYDTLPIAS